MKHNLFHNLIAGILASGLVFFAGHASAAPLVFIVDNTQSQITLSGDIIGFTLTTQGTGSLTTSFSGNINADVSGSAIQFTGSSTITAKTNGVWQPGIGGVSGSAAADYGGQANLSIFGTGFAAGRNVVLDVNSASLPLVGTNFDSTALVFSFATGSNPTLDYKSSPKSGTLALAGNSTNSVANGASLTTNGNVVKLLIQINTQFPFTLLSSGDTTLDLIGQIVATASLTTAPLTISSFALDKTNAVLTVANASAQSQLQISTNLTTWSPATATVSNNAGFMIFTAPVSGPQSFFRVQK